MPSSPSSCTDRGRRCTARRTCSSATAPRPRTWCRPRWRRRTPRGPGCATSTRLPATPGRCMLNTASSWFRKKSWRNERPTEVLPEATYTPDHSDRPTDRRRARQLPAASARRDRAPLLRGPQRPRDRRRPRLLRGHREEPDLRRTRAAPRRCWARASCRRPWGAAMTERLQHPALHDEAARLDIPVPAAQPSSPRDAACAGAVVHGGWPRPPLLAVIGGERWPARSLVTGQRPRTRRPASRSGPIGRTGAFSRRREALHRRTSRSTWDEPIKTLLLHVRGSGGPQSGTSPWTDEATSTTTRWSNPDGSPETGWRSTPATGSSAFEPDSTHVAYAEPTTGGSWDVVVKDVKTGEELGRTTVAGTFTWGGWEAPPVAIDGDWVWVHFDGGWTEVDWRTARSAADAGTARRYTRWRTGTTPTGTATRSGRSGGWRTTRRWPTCSSEKEVVRLLLTGRATT